MSHNEIYLLPDSIGRLCSLLELDISHNCLSELPGSLSALVSLRVLNINSNALTDLVPLFNCDTVPTSRPPNCFCSSCRVSQSDTGEPANRCRSLTPRELHVAGNRIERLPAELLQWRSSLRVLDLSANPLIFPSPHLVARGLPHIFRALASSQRPHAPRAIALPKQQPQRTSTISNVLSPVATPALLTSLLSPSRQKTSVPRTQPPAQCLFLPQTNAIVSSPPLLATAASFAAVAPQISSVNSCYANRFLGPQRSETMPVLPETAASEAGTRPSLRPKPAVKPKPVKSVLGNNGIGVPDGQMYENLPTCTSATSAYAGACARKESAPAGPVFACSALVNAVLNNGSDSGFESNRSSLYATANQNGDVISRAVTSPLPKQATVSQSRFVQSAASPSPRQAQTSRADAAFYENLYVGVNGSPAAVQVLTPDSYAYRQKNSSPAAAAYAALANSVYVPVSPCGGTVQPARGLPCQSQIQRQSQSQIQACRTQTLASAAVAPAFSSPKQPQLPPGAAAAAAVASASTALGGGAQSRPPPPSAADALLMPRSRAPLNGTQLRSTSLPPATHLALDVSLSSIT